MIVWSKSEVRLHVEWCVFEIKLIILLNSRLETGHQDHRTKLQAPMCCC